MVHKVSGLNNESDARQERYTSHALVEVRRFKWLPLAAESAVLLDLSLHGFKLEYTGQVTAKVGAFYWLIIPLAPLGIYSPVRLSCYTECRWFDQERCRLGGVFVALDKTQRMLIDQIVETLQTRGLGGL